ncbi:hypothetical protein EDD76_10561 [Kineothrix alysoides]|uniref:Uncharacterized protein n=1 Tax=Kineothrix alysoides TaxID=1469948 RepID=A0A4R1R0S9_9FIRM|nr:hypothetical protein [Kineothrix alysoides]TCL58891.1 hypothetical protein EDD76_10561 [Kineothrix alysoides]
MKALKNKRLITALLSTLLLVTMLPIPVMANGISAVGSDVIFEDYQIGATPPDWKDIVITNNGTEVISLGNETQFRFTGNTGDWFRLDWTEDALSQGDNIFINPGESLACFKIIPVQSILNTPKLYSVNIDVPYFNELGQPPMYWTTVTISFRVSDEIFNKSEVSTAIKDLKSAVNQCISAGQFFPMRDTVTNPRGDSVDINSWEIMASELDTMALDLDNMPSDVDKVTWGTYVQGIRVWVDYIAGTIVAEMGQDAGLETSYPEIAEVIKKSMIVVNTGEQALRDNDLAFLMGEGTPNETPEPASNNSKSNPSTSSHSEVPTVIETSTNVVSLADGSLVTSTIHGVYIAKAVDGTAITTPQNDVKNALGIAGESTNVSAYFCDSTNKEVNEALKTLAGAQSKTVAACFHADIYSITAQGTVASIKDSKEPVTMVFGTPKHLQGKTLSILCRDTSGNAVIFEDMDSDPNTVTISANVFGIYALVY